MVQKKTKRSVMKHTINHCNFIKKVAPSTSLNIVCIENNESMVFSCNIKI